GVLLLEPADDGLVQIVAGGADRHAGDDPAERDDGDLRGAAPDVDDHVARRLVYRKAGTDRRRHRLLDDVDLPGSGLVAGFLHGALLHGGDPTRYAHHQARLGQVAPTMHLADEDPQHLLGRLEVGDHAVL